MSVVASEAKRMLITGGLGTIGSGLIRELRSRGHHVVSCDRAHQPDERGFSLRTGVEVRIAGVLHQTFA